MERGSRFESLSFREVAEVAGVSSVSSGVSSARARFLVFLLCMLKMDDLTLEGRGRALVVEEVEVDVWARREESWLVKAMVEEVEISLARALGRGIPYRNWFDAIGIEGWNLIFSLNSRVDSCAIRTS